MKKHNASVTTAGFELEALKRYCDLDWIQTGNLQNKSVIAEGFEPSTDRLLRRQVLKNTALREQLN